MGERPPRRVVPLADLGALTEDVRAEVYRVWSEIMATSRFVGGEVVGRFEAEWAQYCGSREAIGVANGTDAIELVLRALRIGRGDEVIVPANTFIATAAAVVNAGAVPHFVDVDPETLLVTAEAISAAVSTRTAAVIAVDLYGSVPDMIGIKRLTDANGLALIEDAAQGHGSSVNGRRAGSFGIAGCFSFYPGKNLGAFGDAGAVVTDDAALAARIRSLANHGRLPGSDTVHAAVGRNSRLDALQAAVLSVKLTRLDTWNEARRSAVDVYRRLLGPEVRQLRVDSDSCRHLNVVLVPERDRVRARLAERGVETSIHYPIPCHRQEPYRRYADGPLPVVEAAAQEILTLPLFPGMTTNQIDLVCAALNELTAVAVA